MNNLKARDRPGANIEISRDNRQTFRFNMSTIRRDGKDQAFPMEVRSNEKHSPSHSIDFDAFLIPHRLKVLSTYAS
jgi:hypothetical protein